MFLILFIYVGLRQVVHDLFIFLVKNVRFDLRGERRLVRGLVLNTTDQLVNTITGPQGPGIAIHPPRRCLAKRLRLCLVWFGLV